MDFMREAILEAKSAGERGEVPIGAVVVLDGHIVARAGNRVEELGDASAHAELLALRAAAKAVGDWRLIDCELYTTIEPCFMCAGAAILSRVKKIFYGAPDLRHGGSQIFANHPIHVVEIEGDLLADECASIIKSFFRNRRLERDGRAAKGAPA
ncbi:MAG: nucleoside deaminase [Simkaniaceae bacterium]|nr:nucleoside deaminase [Simkaniaceae bacterium]